MRKIRMLLLPAILLLLTGILITPESLHAEESGYSCRIADMAELLDDQEEEELYYVMEPGTEYGNMVFLTINDSMNYSSSAYVEMIFQTSPELKGTDAVIFLIDMDNRLLWITGYGNAKKNISPDYANLITDNIYRYASNGDYGKCALEGWEQIVSRLSGERITGPLRTLGNLSVAVIFAAVLCFLIAYASSASRKAAEDDIMKNINRKIQISNPTIQHSKTTKIYDPPKSSGGGGFFSGGGGSGGGGGGFSGGGGGHGF